MLLNKHNKDKFELKWEQGYRIVALPTNGQPESLTKKQGNPKELMLETLNLKTQQRIGTLRQIRGTKFIDDPKALADIDFVDEHDSPIKDDQTLTKDTPKKYDLRKSVKPPKKLDL